VRFTFNNNRQKQSDLFATRNPVVNTNINALVHSAAAARFRHRRYARALGSRS